MVRRRTARALRGIASAVALLSGCGESAETKEWTTRELGGREPIRLVLQRVSATVKRRTPVLVHVQIANERFITTPEHPFAAPDHTWIAAGNLTPGALVISARDGVVPVSSVRREALAQPAPVFNLTVDESHAYLVGTSQVLVHNTGCTNGDGNGDRDGDDPDARLVRELEAAEAELKSLRASLQNARHAPERDAIARLRALRMHDGEARARMHPLAVAEPGQQLRPRDPENQTPARPRIAELRAKIAELSELLRKNRLGRHQRALNPIVGLRIELALNREAAAEARQIRRELRRAGKDTREIDREISERGRERRALLSELAKRRVHELMRGTLHDTGWMYGGRQDLDRARLEEIRHILAEGNLSTERLTEIEQELARSEPIDDEYMAAIWREIDSVDVHAMLGRLQEELNEQFRDFEARDTALGASYESLRDSQSPRGDEPGPSTTSDVSQGLAKIEKARAQLRQDWRYDIHLRLERAQQHLQAIQRSARRRSAPVEAALARIIALLEHEQRNPRF
jgi:hypothetical protein